MLTKNNLLLIQGFQANKELKGDAHMISCFLGSLSAQIFFLNFYVTIYDVGQIVR